MGELKYKFSIKKTLKNIPWFLWIVFFLSLIQILCIKYNFGIAIFDDNLANIVLNICYAILASFIFYFFIEVLPKTEKEYYNNEIVKRNLRGLSLRYDQLKQFLIGIDKIKTLKNNEIDSLELYKRLKKNEQWGNNLRKFKHRSDNIVEAIDKIIKYSTTIDGELLNLLDFVISRIKEINIENWYDAGPIDYDYVASHDGKEIFVDLVAEYYQEIFNAIDKILEKSK